MTTPPQDRTLAAAGLIGIYAVLVGYTDNQLRQVAALGGLFQFHATRSVLALALLAVVAPLLGLRLRPRSWGAVGLRCALHGVAMLAYFAALAILPVAQVLAGLFTAPIFALLIERLALRRPIGPVRVVAVALGFAGVVLVLGPDALAGAGVAVVLPVASGLLYALGHVVTREACPGESAASLLAGFFAGLLVLGLAGMAVLAIWPQPVAQGAAGFALRGPVVPSADVLFWVALQACGAVLGVRLMIRAYQIGTTSRVSVFEYLLLPVSAGWGWLLWGERLGPAALAGMGLIALAGSLIALRAVQPALGAPAGA
ncbi:MAG: DMT family transporter [Rhodobacterales bacterium]|nr:DMT family transporter [Rhodobacterales bacterium]